MYIVPRLWNFKFSFFLKISCNEIGLIINVFAQIIGWSGRKKSIESKT